MAVSINLAWVIKWASTILKQQPFNVSDMEPGLTWASIVLQRVLGPPMRWRFNRANTSFAITPSGLTDYVVSIPTLLWPEAYWLVNTNGAIFPIDGAVELPKTETSDRPGLIAPVYDDNNGNITFRLNAIPDQNYTVFVDYQQKANVFSSYGSTFGPVPDEFMYIFAQLYLGVMGHLVGDPRATLWRQEAMASLLGAQIGLDEQAKAIFIGDFERMLQTMNVSGGLVKLGLAGLAK